MEASYSVAHFMAAKKIGKGMKQVFDTKMRRDGVQLINIGAISRRGQCISLMAFFQGKSTIAYDTILIKWTR
jgi:hypothetical protein